LAALQSGDVHAIALKLAARVNCDTPTCCTAGVACEISSGER
jgi:hypothetical protein